MNKYDHTSPFVFTVILFTLCMNLVLGGINLINTSDKNGDSIHNTEYERAIKAYERFLSEPIRWNYDDDRDPVMVAPGSVDNQIVYLGGDYPPLLVIRADWVSAAEGTMRLAVYDAESASTKMLLGAGWNCIYISGYISLGKKVDKPIIYCSGERQDAIHEYFYEFSANELKLIGSADYVDPLVQFVEDYPFEYSTKNDEFTWDGETVDREIYFHHRDILINYVKRIIWKEKDAADDDVNLHPKDDVNSGKEVIIPKFDNTSEYMVEGDYDDNPTWPARYYDKSKDAFGYIFSEVSYTEAKFCQAGKYFCDRAAVRLKQYPEAAYYIDKDGYLYSNYYMECYPFDPNVRLARVMMLEDSKLAVINTNDQILFRGADVITNFDPITYKSFAVKNGELYILAAGYRPDEKLAFLDTIATDLKGVLSVSDLYGSCLSIFETENGKGIVSIEGEIVLPDENANIEPVSHITNNDEVIFTFIVTDVKGKKEYINIDYASNWLPDFAASRF